MKRTISLRYGSFFISKGQIYNFFVHIYIYERKKPHEKASEIKMLNYIDIFDITIKIISEAV